jgi:IstB-like ATP binding protein
MRSGLRHPRALAPKRRYTSGLPEATAYADFLVDLLSTETAARRERYLRTRTRLALLPVQRPLDQFDFRFSADVDQPLSDGLLAFGFIRVKGLAFYSDLREQMKDPRFAARRFSVVGGIPRTAGVVGHSVQLRGGTGRTC